MTEKEAHIFVSFFSEKAREWRPHVSLEFGAATLKRGTSHSHVVPPKEAATQAFAICFFCPLALQSVT